MLVKRFLWYRYSILASPLALQLNMCVRVCAYKHILFPLCMGSLCIYTHVCTHTTYYIGRHVVCAQMASLTSEDKRGWLVSWLIPFCVCMTKCWRRRTRKELLLN